MLYREVPKNGDKLSILGYGCMRFPNRGELINQKLAEKQLMSAIEQGVNYMDTAFHYHMGKSESFLGKVIAQNSIREKVKFATKLPHWSVTSTADMEKILNLQLKRLQTDHIDYYLIHNLFGETWETAKKKGVLEFMDGALKSGKILNIGFSYHGLADDFNPIVDAYDWTFCQIQYNFLDVENQAGKAGLEYAASKEMAVIVMEPLRGGNLAKSPPPEVKKVWDQAETKRSPAEWSLRWIWDHPEVTVVLSGMNEQKQIDENVKIASVAKPKSLSVTEISLVDKAANTFRDVMRVGCTACQYCMPCPSGVNIPFCFEKFNEYHTFKDKMAKVMYALGRGDSGGPAFASKCTECGDCVEACPQGLEIPDLLKEVSNDLEGFMTKLLSWFLRRIIFEVKDT